LPFFWPYYDLVRRDHACRGRGCGSRRLLAYSGDGLHLKGEIIDQTFFCVHLVYIVHWPLHQVLSDYYKTHQIPKLKIVEHLQVALFGKSLFLVQSPPEAIHRSHVQHFSCINLPCVAAIMYKAWFIFLPGDRRIGAYHS
jgi:hypothetical protein